MSDKAMVPVNFDQLPSTQIGSDEAFDDLSKGHDFLGRLQLFTKGGAINKGLVRPGHFGIPESEDVVHDLGDSVDVLPLARRPKAIDLSDKDAIITVYDMTSDEFKRIVEAAGGSDSGCMYGPSFLVIERSTGRFLEWFCGTKSTRPEAKRMYPYLPLTASDVQARGLDAEPHGPLPFSMKSKLVERRRFSWHVPVVAKCLTPFTSMPSMAKIVAEIERFINPPDAGVTQVDATATGRRAR